MKGARRTTLTFGEDFSLIQVPVAVAPVASSKSDVKTVFIGPSGEQIEQRKIDPGTGELLAEEQIKRAIVNGDGFTEIDEDDWKVITDETKPTEMMVTEFVDLALPIVQERLAMATDAHFVQPQEGAAGSLAVLTSAMRKAGKVAVVRWGAGSRQRLGILRVREDGAMVIQTIPFAADVQAADEDVLAPSEVEVSSKAAKLGKQLIERLSGNGKTLETAEDEAVGRRHALVAELRGGKKPKRSAKKKAAAKSSVEDALEVVLG